MDEIQKILEFIDKEGLYPDIKTISGSPTSTEVLIGGKKVQEGFSILPK